MSQFVVTGSATVDGGPIYLTTQAQWSRRLSDAAVVDETTARERATAAAADEQPTVCDPYVISVSNDGTIRPTSLKECIRADGPTVAFGP